MQRVEREPGSIDKSSTDRHAALVELETDEYISIQPGVKSAHTDSDSLHASAVAWAAVAC
jgi:hypothetical protein